MDIVAIAIALLLGVILGVVIGWLWRSSRSQTGGQDDRARLLLLEDRASRVEGLEGKLALSVEAAQAADAQVIALTSNVDLLETRLEDLKESRESKAASEKAAAEKLAQDQARMVSQIKAAAHEIMEARTKAFDEKSTKSIGELVKPLKEQLEGFRKQLGDNEKHASQERISLKEQVKTLKEMNAQIGEEARNLTRALKGDSKARGNWGEMVLGRVLELSGLEEGREFETEVSETNEEGKRKRPDVIVHLPGDRQVVIDAKVSLVDYDAYCEAENQDDQDAAMKRHVASIRTHAKGLSSKDYQQLKSITSLDYVLMFMPIEAAFTAAMRADREIFDEAISKRVLIVTPSTLLAVLRTIESIWRHEKQTKNTMEIARQAGALFDKFVTFSASLEKIGDRIGQAQVEYDRAFNQLSTGKGNLVSRVKKLEALGAKTSKRLPDSLTDAMSEEAGGPGAAPLLDLVVEEGEVGS